MFCVIQKVKNKTPNPYGTHKELLVNSTIYGMDGVKVIKYGYKYSEERFERSITDAYKISIHHSYREDGKVKKEQWVIVTMKYYDLIEFGLWDCAGGRIERIAKEIGITEEKLYEMIYAKLDPLVEQVTKEFETTEEYKAKKEQEKILSQYREHKSAFDELYGFGAYDTCYDIYGNVMDMERLKELRAQKKANDEYKKRSHQRSYESNYNSQSYSSNVSNYTDEEKAMLKKIYREAAKKFHPDVAKDDGATMKLLTKLKKQWGV
jgi:hypothetical protein